MKRLILFILVLFCFNSNAQTLKTTNLNLSTDGKVYDVEYIPSVNAYVVVGEFTTIGGFARKNLAYLNANNLTVIGGNPISSIDGAIRSVEYHSFVNAGTTYHYMAIGGEFNTINGNPRESLALFYTTGGLALNAFPIYTWNYALQNGDGNINNDGVFDLEFKGDTLLVGGVFQGINLQLFSSTNVNIVEDNFLKLKAITTGAKLDTVFSANDPDLFPHYDVGAFSILNTTNHLFVGGLNFPINNGLVQALIHRYTTSGVQNGSFTASSSNRHGFHSLAKLNDTLILATDAGLNGTANLSSNMIICKQTGNAPSGNAQYAINPLLSGFASNVWGQQGYNGDLFMYKGTTPTLQRQKLNSALVSNGLDFALVGTSVSVTSPGSHIDSTNNLMLEGRYLFLSERGMTTVGGQTRNGLAAFCLEPENPLAFVNPDLSVCPDETVTYAIPDVNYETGYRWTYTGTGVEYSVNGGAFQNYTVPVMNTTANAASITLRFPLGSTGGTLSVEPYNTCNTTTDYLYAKTQSITITVNVQPDLALNADSLWFTCVVDSLDLVAQSVTPSLVYQWAYPNVLTPVSSNDTLLVHATGVFPSIFYPTGTYFVTITNPLTGCTNRDSLFIGQNTLPPTITQDSLSSNPATFTCSTTQMQLIASAGNATIYWTAFGDPNTQYPNPHTVYSTSPQTYTAHATSLVNGCQASQDFQIYINDTTFIAGALPSHPAFPNVFTTDTINCVTPSLLVQCGVDPMDANAAFGSAYWIQTATTDLGLTAADSAGMIQNANTWQFVTLNSQNDCLDTFDVVIYFDLDRPFVVDYTGAASLNCSVDTMTIIHPLTGGAVTESWLDGSGIPTGSNSLFVNAIGDYVYQVTYNQNGCVASDTVSVIQTSELFLSSNDTLVCPGLPFTVGTTIINNSETPTYLWSNGAATPTTDGTGGTDTELSVIVTTQSGCIGYDTIDISITPPIDITTAGFMSCGAASGSLQVTNATGGAGGYQYSIDGATYNSATLFDSLAAGTYSIYVKDALGCVYTFEDTLDPMASAPTMDFLVTTYSGFNDTLAIVNTTVFAGFDSTNWVFPAGTIVYYNSDSLALIQLPDTGWYEIALIGFDDTCQYAFAKTIYSGEISPEYNTDYNSLKIQSLNVFPNPTNGTFTLEMVFGAAQNYTAIVTDNLSIPLSGMQQSGYGTTVTLPFQFPVGTSSGSYHLRVISDYDVRHITLILN